MTKRTKGRMRKKNKPKHVPVPVHKEAAQPDENVADIISELSDDILVSIISRLPLREATATSVLSTRWHHLHTRLSRLIFPPFCTKLEKTELEKRSLILKQNFLKYIKTINHTLDSYKGGHTLKEFRVHMLRIEGANIRRCFEFALSREVEILDILRPIPNYHVWEDDFYNLQLENLIKSGCQTGLKCLKELSLCHVDTGDVEIKLLLSNSPHLESFSLDCTSMQGNVSIEGHSKLQHLSISHPLHLESIEIKNMPNLVSLRCIQLRLSRSGFARLDNLPKLIELETSDEGRFYESTLCHILSNLPSYICSQLVVVRSSVSCYYIDEFRLPKLINVKYLELECHSPDWCRDVRQLVRLLEACCSLEKLEMKSEWCQNTVKATKFGVREVGDRLYWMGKASPKLNKVKLSGYLGSQTEFEFATYIIQNVGALQQLTVEPCRVSKHIRHKVTANFWKQLRPVIPESLDLKFINGCFEPPFE